LNSSDEVDFFFAVYSLSSALEDEIEVEVDDEEVAEKGANLVFGSLSLSVTSIFPISNPQS
jgi:hypothetical protein